jgi:hypothetical protein
MSVARAEAELAAVLMVELMVAIAEEDEGDDDEPVAPVPSVAAPEPVAAAA